MSLNPARGSSPARLTATRIVFMVVAAAAPIGAIVSLTPLQYAIGNGAGAPGTYVVAGSVLLCFGVGYAAMARHITNTGGFYTFISRGLGRPIGVPSAFIALIAYFAVGLQLAAGFGYFMALLCQQLLGLATPWYLWTAIGAAISGVLAYRSVNVSAKVLGLLVLFEIGILMVLNIAIVGEKGASALPATSFNPGTVFAGGFAVALLLAFNSFIGFESAALYGEESQDPKRTIPRAVYGSLLLITAFYAITSWLGVGASGAEELRGVAQEELGNYWFVVADRFIGTAFSSTVSVLLCTSLFASLMSIQNATSRYVYSLGREGVLHSWAGQRHLRYESPSRATLIVTAINILVPGVFALTNLDPYLTLVSSMAGLGALGIITLQGLAAASVIGFFRRHPDRGVWQTLLAPGIGLIGLVIAATLVVMNFALLTGTDSAAVHALPWLIPAAAAGGFGYARWLRHNRPTVYAELGSDSHCVNPESRARPKGAAHPPELQTES